MLSLLGMFSRASAKLLATFVTVILLMLFAFAFAPWLITALQDLIEGLDAMLRDPPLNQQAKVLYRTLVNENTMFGIVMTIIARAIVETVAWAGGAMMRGGAGRDDGGAGVVRETTREPTPPGPKGASDYYGTKA